MLRKMFDRIPKERFLNLYNYFENIRQDSQRRKLGEEHQELIEELVLYDIGYGSKTSIIDELADNFNLLFQIMYAYDIESKEVYDRLIQKLERTEQRKKDKYYEK